MGKKIGILASKCLEDFWCVQWFTSPQGSVDLLSQRSMTFKGARAFVSRVSLLPQVSDGFVLLCAGRFARFAWDGWL